MTEREDLNADIEHTVFPVGDASMPSAQSAEKLLAGLNARTTEPIDQLLDRLCADGQASRLLMSWTDRQDPPLWQRIVAGEANEADLEAARQQSKLGFHPDTPPAHRDAALLGYIVAVAAGVIAVGRANSSVPAQTLEEWFTAVAGAAAGDALAGLLTRAAAKLGSMS